MKQQRRIATFTCLAILTILGMQGASALPEYPYDATCNTGERCLFGNADYVLPPVAAQRGDDWAYTENYPNTNSGINDSVSSMKNRHGTYAVRFYTNAEWTGFGQCLAKGKADPVANYNDAYSSHVSMSGGTC